MSLTAKPLGMNNPMKGGQVTGGPVYTTAAVSSGMLGGQSSGNDPMNMLSMRMRWHNMIRAPFEHISVYYNTSHPTAFVFIVHEGKPVTLCDDAALYPSDQLISQLRLLLG